MVLCCTGFGHVNQKHLNSSYFFTCTQLYLHVMFLHNTLVCFVDTMQYTHRLELQYHMSRFLFELFIAKHREW